MSFARGSRRSVSGAPGVCDHGLSDEPDAVASGRPQGWNRFDLSADEIRQRMRWASATGRATWLWPDIQIGDWRDTLERIEGVVRNILEGHASAWLDGDEQALGLACYTSGVGPLLGWWLRQGRLAAPPPVAALLELHLQHNLERHAQVQQAALDGVRAIRAGGVGVLVLKGLHTGTDYFPHPATRPASDIDLLVSPADAPAAENVLRQNGFLEWERNARESSWALAGMARLPRSLMLAHAENPWSIDLHSSLDIGVGTGSPPATLSRADPMRSPRRWSGEPSAQVLDQPLLALHLAVHAGAGLHSLSLLRLIELHLVVTQDSKAGLLSWAEFLALGARTDALGFAFPGLQLCEQLVPGTVPAFVLERCRAAAPARARKVVARLTPATAQRVERNWISEHYMWVRGARGWARQLIWDFFPSVSSWKAFWTIYQRRWWRLVRGRIGA